MQKILEDPFTFALIWVFAAIKVTVGFFLGYWAGWWHTYLLGTGWFCDDLWLWSYVFGGINGVYSLSVAILFTWLFFIEKTIPPNGGSGETIFLKAA